VLALPASWGQDAKDDKKAATPQEKYAALLKEFRAEQEKIVTEANKVKGEELQKFVERYYGLGKQFADRFYKLAEDNPKDQVALDALVWVAQNGSGSPAFPKAVDRLLEKYPDNAAIERVAASLGRSSSPDAADGLKRIMEKAAKPRTKAVAAVSLGRSLAARVDKLGENPEADKVAAEAEKYFVRGIELYGKDPATKEAERELNALRTVRIGKPAPEIKAEDLDGKEFKLSDYRGKVVLLDFWGNW
jgi:hypothetical protein